MLQYSQVIKSHMRTWMFQYMVTWPQYRASWNAGTDPHSCSGNLPDYIAWPIIKPFFNIVYIIGNKHSFWYCTYFVAVYSRGSFFFRVNLLSLFYTWQSWWFYVDFILPQHIKVLGAYFKIGMTKGWVYNELIISFVTYQLARTHWA